VTPDIPPNTGLNKLRAVLIGAFGLIALGVVALIADIPGGPRWGAMAVPFFIALGIFWYAARLYARPPKSGGSIAFRPDGFDLYIKQAFRPKRHHVFNWADLDRIVHAVGGYGVRFFEFQVTDAAAKRMGHIQPTARENRPAIFGFRTLRVSTVLIGPSADEVVARLAEAAKDAGFAIEKEKFRFGPFFNRTVFSVTKSQ
jgi:hypothetical protein